MARQKGILKIKGTIGDISFYKTKDGYMVREKTGVDPKRIANDPAFQRTRENGAEFGRAANAVKVLKASIRPLLFNTVDSRMTARLQKRMVKVLQADMVSERGRRTVIDGEAITLEGFEFNNRAPLGSTFYAPYKTSIDRSTGEIILDVPQFVPVPLVKAPKGTTHFKIISAGVEIDFEGQVYVTDISESAEIPWAKELTPAITHNNRVTAESSNPLFLVMGVEFYQVVNAHSYPLNNGAHNPLEIVKVEGGA